MLSSGVPFIRVFTQNQLALRVLRYLPDDRGREALPAFGYLLSRISGRNALSTTAPTPVRHVSQLLHHGMLGALAVLLAVASVVGLSPAASAATPGITSTILLGDGGTYDGTQVVNEGDTLKLRVQYNNQVAPGSTVVFELGPNVRLTGVPAANTAIESVTHVDGTNTVSITFKDPWPPEINQGVFDLDFVVNDVDESVKGPITWKIDGEESSVDVIIRNSGDQFANVSNGVVKARTSPGNLNSFVSVDYATNTVTVNPTILNQDITYRLNVDSETARTGYTIADSPHSYLAYQSVTSATITQWDVDGLNRTQGPFTFNPTATGNGFTWTGDIPGPSQLAITYTARVANDAQRLALQAELQAAYNAAGGNPGAFPNPALQLTNTATFGGNTTRTATIGIQGTIAGPGVGAATGKAHDWTDENPANTHRLDYEQIDASGNVTPAQAITYTLRADLRGWDARPNNPNYTLTQDAVLRDRLPAGTTWLTGEVPFITAGGTWPHGALSSAGTCPAGASDSARAEAFRLASSAGQYCTDGQLLLINVGQNNTTNATFDVEAEINQVSEVSGTSTVRDAVRYRVGNTVTLQITPVRTGSASTEVFIERLPEARSGGLNDTTVFSKSGNAEQEAVNPGETVTVDYTFRVGAGKGIDVRTSQIVDYVDADVFDVSDLGSVQVTGSYDGQPLNASHFDVSAQNGNLVIELSAAGVAVVDARGVDQELVVNLSLTTRPFEGKETKVITNRASLLGSDGTPLYWDEDEEQATSYGDEAEVRKRVYDRDAQEWVETLRAQTDGEGNLVQDTYVYRIEFLPHGNYDDVVIVDVNDILPAATQFLGFVTEENAATGAGATPGPVDIGGNLEATYDAATGTVTLKQKDGTRLDAEPGIAAYVAVRITDATAPIVNTIGSTSATIVPLKKVSVGDYVWVDQNKDGRQGPGEPGIPGVVLTIVGPDGQPVTDVFGNLVGPTTTGPNGEYTFENLPALTGSETYTVRIDREASEEALRPYVPTRSGIGDREGDSSSWEASTQPGDLHEDGDRDPTLDFGFVTKTYAIGDYVWIDKDKDGKQDPGERPLAGVKVKLIKDGKVIATTTTDKNGRYVFDNLPAGKYQVKFELTKEQKKKYKFTDRDSGSDDRRDSDARRSDGRTKTIVLGDSNEELTHDYDYRDIAASEGIDPTWDAGVIVKDDVDDPGDKPKDPDDKNKSKNANAGTGLPNAGSPFGLWLIGSAIALLGVGGWLLAGRRRDAGGS
ncbi:MAG: carboxypeptidase regulatory-like domain-containing protein [Nocardioidaceae bacterium]|nr:MAG: carboxypeptidase regulatory-like domain-containing protein [Nocardioidaceae bacterium]